MPAGWKPITVQKIIQIQSNLEYCVLTGCDCRRWDGNAIFSFLLKRFQLTFLMLSKPMVTAKYAEVFDCAKPPDGIRRKKEREK